MAYAAAVIVPEFFLSDIPTVGLSCAIYTLIGSFSFQVKRKIWFQSVMAAYIGIGFLFPSVNAVIHIYGYLAGLLVGLLDTPLQCFRK